MNAPAAITNVWARGARPEARGEDFQPKARIFPLATSLAPLACWRDFATNRHE